MVPMPRLPNSRLTAQLQKLTRSQFYGDSASILQYAPGTLDSYGQASAATTTTTAIACSFTDLSGTAAMEKWMSLGDVAQVVAEIRWEGSPTPANGDEVTLTGRFDGTGMVDQTFEVVGIQDRDTFGYVCALQKVANNG